MLNIPELKDKLLPLDPESLEGLGDILQYALPWATLFFVALTGSVRGAQAWAYAGIINSLLTFILKTAFNSTSLGRRPNGGNNSFPSGHTSSAFMGAGFAHFYFAELWVIVPYLLAGITGYSRVVSENHWWRDVLAGAALGIFVSYATLAILI